MCVWMWMSFHGSWLGFIAENTAVHCVEPSHTGAQCDQSGVCGPYGPAAPADDPSGFSLSQNQDAIFHTSCGDHPKLIILLLRQEVCEQAVQTTRR